MLLVVVKPRVEIWSVNYCFISDASSKPSPKNRETVLFKLCSASYVM